MVEESSFVHKVNHILYFNDVIILVDLIALKFVIFVKLLR